MKTSKVLVRSFFTILAVASIVFLSLAIRSPKAPAPSAAAKPSAESSSPNPPLTLAPPAVQGSVLPNLSLTIPGSTAIPLAPSLPQPPLSFVSSEDASKNADSTGTRLPPGIYSASPSTGIIVVPAPTDQAFEKPVAPGLKMPTVEPPLQLTPISR